MSTYVPDSGTPVLWIRRAVQGAKYRAAQKGILFNITAEDMVAQWRDQDGVCYWFNVPMGSPEDHRHHPLAPSLDQVMPGNGYTWGNVVWACLAANTAKRDTDPDCWEEFLSLLKVCMRDWEP